jgi:hypothetical protein
MYRRFAVALACFMLLPLAISRAQTQPNGYAPLGAGQKPPAPEVVLMAQRNGLVDALRARPESWYLDVLDLGCRIDDPSFHDNARLINEALVEMQLGQREWATLVLPPGELYTYEDIVFPPKTGMAMFGTGSGLTYQLGAWEHTPKMPGGRTSKIVRVDGGEGGAVIRLQGFGTALSNFVIQGRRKPKSWKESEGERAAYGILVEGRGGVAGDPPTGKHHFDNLTFIEVRTPFYFPRNDVLEHHADSCTYGKIIATGFDTFFHAVNLQSISHTFYSDVELIGGAYPQVAFHVERGGDLKVNKLMWYTVGTILKLGQNEPNGFSPHTNRFDIHFRWDTPRKMSDFVLVDISDGKDYPFSIRMSGLIAALPGKHYDPAKLLKFAPKARRQDADLWLDITNLPRDLAAKYPWGGKR